MKSSQIEKVLTTVFKEKYPELEFECFQDVFASANEYQYRLDCSAPKEFYYRPEVDIDNIEPEIRSIFKMMGIYSNIRIYFMYSY
jgi:hypothetical protein